jgi:hypothetical protein
MLHVPRVGYSLPVTPMKSICRRADYFRDDEGSLPRGRELVHAVSLLDASKDKVAKIEGGFLNIAVVVAMQLLVVTGLPHDSGESLFFKTVEVDATCLLGLSFLIELNSWSSKGDIGRKYGF